MRSQRGLSLPFIDQSPFKNTSFNTYPYPSGPYAVGSKIFHLIDPNRPETYSADGRDFSQKNPNHNRELMIKLYYPCDGHKKATKIADSIMPYWQKYLEAEIQAGLVTEEMLQDFNNIYTYCKVGTEPIRYAPFPLILFSPGYDSGPYTYTAFCEGLASEGYVVCFINHTYAMSLVSFPDGRDIFLGAQPDSRVVDVCTADVPLVLEELARINATDTLLKGIIDLNSTAFAGHSLGGMVSINSIKRIPQIKTGVSLDPPLDPSVLGLSINRESYDATEPIHKPFLYILAGNHETIYAQSSLKFRLGEDIEKIIIDGSSHNGFSDYCLYKHLVPWLQRLKGDLDTGPMDGYDLVAVTLGHINKFLHKHLAKGLTIRTA